jgi:hypothetical protein
MPVAASGLFSSSNEPPPALLLPVRVSVTPPDRLTFFPFLFRLSSSPGRPLIALDCCCPWSSESVRHGRFVGARNRTQERPRVAKSKRRTARAGVLLGMAHASTHSSTRPTSWNAQVRSVTNLRAEKQESRRQPRSAIRAHAPWSPSLPSWAFLRRCSSLRRLYSSSSNCCVEATQRDTARPQFKHPRKPPPLTPRGPSLNRNSAITEGK